MGQAVICECGYQLSKKARTCSNCDEMFNEELETYIEAIETRGDK
jgi:hypothetical protein